MIIDLSRKGLYLISSLLIVSIKDYKLLFLDGSEKTVDTSLSLEGILLFSGKDYFEFLTFQTWEKLLINWDIISMINLLLHKWELESNTLAILKKRCSLL